MNKLMTVALLISICALSFTVTAADMDDRKMIAPEQTAKGEVTKTAIPIKEGTATPGIMTEWCWVRFSQNGYPDRFWIEPCNNL